MRLLPDIEQVSLETMSDEELAALVSEKQECFAVIIRRYEAKLTRYVHRIGGGNKETVEDIVQNIFIKAYIHIQSFRAGQKFSSWIYRIAHNESIDFWRRNKKHATISLDDNQELAAVIASEENIEKNFYAKEDALLLQEILSHMPEESRTVLVLRYLEEKDYQEMSDILKKPVATIGTLLYRAKKKLKDHVDMYNKYRNEINEY